MARAITRSASASESAISSASTSWLLKLLRLASERRRVSMPCMVSASRLIMRASPLTSSEPCVSQRLSMSPAASACATSPTSCNRVLDGLRNRPEHQHRDERGRQRAADQTQLFTGPGSIRFGEHPRFDALQDSRACVSSHRAIAVSSAARRGSRSANAHADGATCAPPCAHVVSTLSRYCAAGLPQRIGDRRDFGSRRQRPGEIELRAQRADQVVRRPAGDRRRRTAVPRRCWPAGSVRDPASAARRRRARGRRWPRTADSWRAGSPTTRPASASTRIAKHYVETPGDGNRCEPPARVSSCHCSTPLPAIRTAGYRRRRGGP